MDIDGLRIIRYTHVFSVEIFKTYFVAKIIVENVGKECFHAFKVRAMQ